MLALLKAIFYLAFAYQTYRDAKQNGTWDWGQARATFLGVAVLLALVIGGGVAVGSVPKAFAPAAALAYIGGIFAGVFVLTLVLIKRAKRRGLGKAV